MSGYWKNQWASPNDSSGFAWNVQYPTEDACYRDTLDRGYGPGWGGGRFCTYIETATPQPLPEPPTPPIEPRIDDKKGIDPKMIIIAVIAFILLLKR